MRTLALGVWLFLTSNIFANEQHDWKTGKIISQNVISDNNGTAVVPVGGIIAAVPIKRVTNTVIMEANGYRFTLVEKQTKHYLVLAENSDAQFYKDESGSCSWIWQRDNISSRWFTYKNCRSFTRSWKSVKSAH
jgi:hypothetical protein